MYQTSTFPPMNVATDPVIQAKFGLTSTIDFPLSYQIDLTAWNEPQGRAFESSSRDAQNGSIFRRNALCVV